MKVVTNYYYLVYIENNGILKTKIFVIFNLNNFIVLA